jgi:Icc-related predicted phosphoesterase
VLHRRLRAGTGGGLRARGRVLIVGDVHGCATELRALLQAAGFTPGVDALVVTGDLVTKGPDSRGVGSKRAAGREAARRGSRAAGRLTDERPY